MARGSWHVARDTGMRHIVCGTCHVARHAARCAVGLAPRAPPQVSLCDPRPAAFPHFARAVGAVVTLNQGDLFFLPAYWWHEVITEPAPPSVLTVSVNFWFSIREKLHSPPLPLPLNLRVELCRQVAPALSAFSC